jgi:hypothetical protein
MRVIKFNEKNLKKILRDYPSLDEATLRGQLDFQVNVLEEVLYLTIGWINDVGGIIEGHWFESEKGLRNQFGYTGNAADNDWVTLHRIAGWKPVVGLSDNAAMRVNRLRSGNWQFGCESSHHVHDPFCHLPSVAELALAGLTKAEFRAKARTRA